jgi:predicted phosphodiesterase
MSRVGIIGDTHIPYELEGYLEFCQETFEQWGVDRVVHIGDLIDHHALSSMTLSLCSRESMES